MEKEQAKLRILMFPYLSYSHVFPYFELAKRLSNRNLHIYFGSSALNPQSIKKTMQKQSPSIEFLELKVPSLPQLPPNLHTTKNAPHNISSALLQAFQLSRSSFSEIFNSLKPDLVIYDYFEPWVPKLASPQGVPSVYFATVAAATFSYFHHIHTYGSLSTFPFKEIYLLEHEEDVVNAPAAQEVEDADDQDFADGMLTLSSEIVLIKGTKGFDGKHIDYLSALCQKRVVPVGLLVHESKGNEETHILQWLSGKDRFSTLFICFGSEYFLSKDQIQEISKGLELCDVINFIWAVKFSAKDAGVTLEEALPPGFLERVKGRGIVVDGWVPQSKILSNPSTGAFASHCGWSSVTESLYYGVPIVAMPIRCDQPINARMVVEAGVGVEVVKGQDGVFSGEELSKSIGEVFAKRAGEDIRSKARRLSVKFKEEEEQELDEMAEQIRRLCLKNK